MQLSRVLETIFIMRVGNFFLDDSRVKSLRRLALDAFARNLKATSSPSFTRL